MALNKNQSGSRFVKPLLVLVALGIIGFITWQIMHDGKAMDTPDQASNTMLKHQQGRALLADAIDAHNPEANGNLIIDQLEFADHYYFARGSAALEDGSNSFNFIAQHKNNLWLIIYQGPATITPAEGKKYGLPRSWY